MYSLMVLPLEGDLGPWRCTVWLKIPRRKVVPLWGNWWVITVGGAETTVLSEYGVRSPHGVVSRDLS
jgi:hypothetical protein